MHICDCENKVKSSVTVKYPVPSVCTKVLKEKHVPLHKISRFRHVIAITETIAASIIINPPIYGYASVYNSYEVYNTIVDDSSVTKSRELYQTEIKFPHDCHQSIYGHTIVDNSSTIYNSVSGELYYQ